jgi:hypothetical protein
MMMSEGIDAQAGWRFRCAELSSAYRAAQGRDLFFQELKGHPFVGLARLKSCPVTNLFMKQLAIGY